MNCNCIDELKEKIKTLEQPKLKAPIESVTCKSIGFVLGESLQTVLNIPFSIKADAPGYRAKSGKELPVIASYCPFCGVSARKQPQEPSNDQ